MLNRRILYTLLILICATVVNAGVKSDSLQPGRTITVIPGEEYAAGAFHRFFLGDHWRSLWTAPLEAQVLDLNSYAGGLTPLKRGGGFQTMSLHFTGNDGKFYKFRSLNKDPKKVLPKYLRDTFVADVFKDQISTSHPLSAFIVSPLLNAVGVLNAEPILVVLPDDPGLGEYRADYAGLLGTLAENPKDDTEADLIFAGADKVKKSYDVFEAMEKNHENKVDEAEYLKARLMDGLLGDWDRHVGQWKWARYKTKDRRIWVPIPRDRDQAFSLYDGVFPAKVDRAITQIEGYDEDFAPVYDLTWSGRYLDRRFLVSITRSTWDSITTYIKTKITDEVIENAVRKMPPEWFDLEGDYLIETLKNRRDNLEDYSADYYEMIFKYVSVYASDKSEFARITRLNDQSVEVAIYDKNMKKQTIEEKPFFYRVFDTDETSEIRIELLGGDDTAVITGDVDESILFRIAGGDGADKLIDSSVVSGYFLSVTPFAAAEKKAVLYDSGKKTKFFAGPSTVINKEKAPKPKPFNEDTDEVNEKYEPPVEDRGHDWRFGSWLNFNADDGLVFGTGPILYEFGYRVSPHVYRMSLLGAYATNPKSFRIQYNGEFYSLWKGKRILIDAGISELGFTKFYGFGNDTKRDDNLEDADFYRVKQRFTNLQTSVEFTVNKKSHFWLGASFNRSRLNFDQGTILDSLALPNSDKFTYLGLHTGFMWDTRDHTAAPMQGFFLEARFAHFPMIRKGNKPYTTSSLDTRFYLTTDIITRSTLALRAAGEKVWGDYPIFEAAFIGGENSIRGLNRERFAGDASVFGNIELRSYLFPLKIVIPGRLGFSAFIESGRVYLSGETSEQWHASYGGGVWLSFINRLLILNFTLAQSSEKSAFYFGTNFMF